MSNTHGQWLERIRGKKHGEEKNVDDNEKIIAERYRLTLKHEIIGDDGFTLDIEEPIVAEMLVQLGDMTNPFSIIVVNELLDKLRDYVLRKKEQGDE